MNKTTKLAILIIAMALLAAPYVVASSQAKEEQILTKLVIIPQNVILDAGESIQFTVKAFDQYDRAVEVPAIFSVEHRDIGTVSSTGHFTALEHGNTKVMALFDAPSGRTLYDASIVKIREKQNVNIIIWLMKLLQLVE